MVQLDGMRLVQQSDGTVALLHERLAEPLPVPREQLERWLLRLVRQSLTLPQPQPQQQA